MLSFPYILKLAHSEIIKQFYLAAHKKIVSSTLLTI